MSYLDEKIDSRSSDVELLPVFHSCDSYFFRAIINNRKLSPSDDTVFENERLLYLFYGRPAYKSANQQSSKLKSFLPVSIILKSEALSDIKRIASFDTGAFKVGLYKDYMHPAAAVSSFFLTPDLNSVRKAISYFFGTNENYFRGIPKEVVKYDPLDFEIESFYHLINGIEQRPVDDRKATFEIQLDHEIQLTQSSVEAVILPDIFLSSDKVKSIVVDELKAETIPYETYGIPSPQNYSHVLSLTKNYLTRKQYLSENNRVV